MSRRQRHIRVRGNEHVVIHFGGRRPRRRPATNTRRQDDSLGFEQVLDLILQLLVWMLKVANDCLDAMLNWLWNFIPPFDCEGRRKPRRRRR